MRRKQPELVRGSAKVGKYFSEYFSPYKNVESTLRILFLLITCTTLELCCSLPFRRSHSTTRQGNDELRIKIRFVCVRHNLTDFIFLVLGDRHRWSRPPSGPTGLDCRKTNPHRNQGRRRALRGLAAFGPLLQVRIEKKCRNRPTKGFK